jgi:hypothetical protein
MNEPITANPPFWRVVSHDDGARFIARPLIVTSGYQAFHDIEATSADLPEPPIKIVVNTDGSMLVTVGDQAATSEHVELDAALVAAIEEGWQDVDAGRVASLDLEMLERD